MSEIPPASVPQPQTSQDQESSKAIWLIPIVTALLGLWLVYESYSEQGVVIHIQFETASGLEAGKTQIQFKGVEVGVVEKIELSDGLESVVLEAKIKPSMQQYLTENTQFWIVKPRIGAQGVSGLNTLLSGAFITLDPGAGEPTTSFVGLEQPPLTPADALGKKIILQAEDVAMLEPGTPIYYHKIKAGTIEARAINEDGTGIKYTAFVRAPFDQQITLDSRFWNVSGVSFDVGTDGLKVQTPSLDAMLTGGIAFDNRDAQTLTAPSGSRFRLYSSLQAIEAEQFQDGERYVVQFDESVRGLNEDAPVEFSGIQIGRVAEVQLAYDIETNKVVIPVIVEIHPHLLTGRYRDARAKFAELVTHGLRARLTPASLLTGSLLIELGMFADPNTGTITVTERGRLLPSVAGQFSQLGDSVAGILDKVNHLPLDELIGNASSAMSQATLALAGLSKLTQSKAMQSLPKTARNVLYEAERSMKTMVKSLNKTLRQAETTLAAANNSMQAINEGSPLYSELSLAARELTETIRTVRALVNSVKKQPNSVIFGR